MLMIATKCIEKYRIEKTSLNRNIFVLEREIEPLNF